MKESISKNREHILLPIIRIGLGIKIIIATEKSMVVRHSVNQAVCLWLLTQDSRLPTIDCLSLLIQCSNFQSSEVVTLSLDTSHFAPRTSYLLLPHPNQSLPLA